MTQSLEQAKGDLELLVAHLIRPDEADLSFAELVERARTTFDGRTASGVGWALVDALSRDGANLEILEALIILGMAYPRVLNEHSISLEAEGRRLVALLERKEAFDKARGILEVLVELRPHDPTLRKDLEALLRRVGEKQELADQYIRRAQDAAKRKKYAQAIQWLQEILLHDHSRRDVARMIRDLRLEMDRRERRSRSLRRNLLLLVLFGSVIGMVGVRELRLFQEYQLLLTQPSVDLASASGKLANIEGLVASQPFWIGRFTVEPEVSRLRGEIAQIESQDARLRNEELARRREDLDGARVLREQGLSLVHHRSYGEAVVKLRAALELGGEGWEPGVRVAKDIAAIEEILKTGQPEQ